MFLTPTDLVMTLSYADANTAANEKREGRVKPERSAPKPHVKGGKTGPANTTTLRMLLVGANPNPTIKGLDELPGKVNYFRSKDPKQWRTDIPTYAKVKVEKIYPGVDLVYYGNQRQLEYDFIVAPGADPKAVRLAFAGSDKLTVDPQGNLILPTKGGKVYLNKPVLYQDVDGKRQRIEGRYQLYPAKGQGHEEVGFQVAAYDRSKPLIIDPVLVYSTYLGGALRDNAMGIAVDSAGNAYVAGYTFSGGYEPFSNYFPTQTPLQANYQSGYNDAFVSKLNASGSALVYSTYLGGSALDYAMDIAVDSAGNAYVGGYSTSLDFPTLNPVQANNQGGIDAFVSKLNAAGNALIYSTYLGGTSGDRVGGITVDSAGNAYVGGYSASLDFPTLHPVQAHNNGSNDAFVSKLNASGSALVYSTYLGGSALDYVMDIAVDSAGTAYVGGYSTSLDFPTLNPVQAHNNGSNDAFVSKLNASGSALVYSTYLGGSALDYAMDIAVDSAGNAYVGGYSTSLDFPTLNPLQAHNNGSNDAFVSKLNAAGNALAYSTYLGGTSEDNVGGITVDSAGNAYVAGYSASLDFPTLSPVQTHNNGSNDAFVSKLNASGSALVYSTYLGGTDSDKGMGIAVDSKGNTYVTGFSASSDFPTQTPLQANNQGSNDAFITKISDFVDSDSDGLPDDWEIDNGFNPNDPNDAGLDKDNDGLTNLEEFQNNTNPNNPDTDGDGYNDGDEVDQGTDPLDPNSYPTSLSKLEIADPACVSQTDCKGDFLESRLGTVLPISNKDKLLEAKVTRTGILSDGVTLLLLRIKSDSPVTFTIKSPDGSLAGGCGWGKLMRRDGSSGTLDTTTSKCYSIEVIPEKTASGNYAFAIYQAPSDFPYGGAEVRPKFTLEATSSGGSSQASLNMRPPPVVMVHGVWSNGNAWEKLEKFLKAKGYDICDGCRPDYGNLQPAGEFDPLANKPEDRKIVSLVAISVRKALKASREVGNAATQVDIVGHSMGGGSRAFHDR